MDQGVTREGKGKERKERSHLQPTMLLRGVDSSDRDRNGGEGGSREPESEGVGSEDGLHDFRLGGREMWVGGGGEGEGRDRRRDGGKRGSAREGGRSPSRH